MTGRLIADSRRFPPNDENEKPSLRTKIMTTNKTRNTRAAASEKKKRKKILFLFEK